MSTLDVFSRGAVALTLVLAACGDDINNTECGTGTMLVDGECVAGTPTECGAGTTLTNGECVSDVVCGTGTMNMAGMCVPTTATTAYRQVEHLGRPGIAEALLLSNGFLDAYNATAPFYVGVDPGALGMVVGEAKTVLRALFYGTCLLNGIAGFSDPTMGAKPGGVQCAATGTGIFADGGTNGAAGVVLATGTTDAATTYANRVFDQFVPDVLRIDTVPDASTYLTLCGAAATGEPLLCGGRHLRDDVIDTTYYYLLAGASVPTGATTTPVVNQVVALVTDGVYFSSVAAQNVGTLGSPDPTNRNQFKPAVSGTFPYSAAPL